MADQTISHTRVVLDIRLEKPVPELADLVAGRAWSIDGVAGCEVIYDADLAPGVYKFKPIEKPFVPEPKPSLWQRIKAYLW